MREAQALAAREGVTLTDADISAWMKMTDALNPDGMPSMRQDVYKRQLIFMPFVLLVKIHGSIYAILLKIFCAKVFQRFKKTSVRNSVPPLSKGEIRYATQKRQKTQDS